MRFRLRLSSSSLILTLSAGLLVAASASGLAPGPVVGWGYNFYGESTPPASVNGTSGTATAIAAGLTHSCAIQSGTGAVICWGDNTYGQLNVPASVNGTSGSATAIAAGFAFSCAIQAGTGVEAFLWNGDSGAKSPTPLGSGGRPKP